MNTNCTFDPTNLNPEFGITSCPVCGATVIPGAPHPSGTPPLTDEELWAAANLAQLSGSPAADQKRETD